MIGWLDMTRSTDCNLRIIITDKGMRWIPLHSFLCSQTECHSNAPLIKQWYAKSGRTWFLVKEDSPQMGLNDAAPKAHIQHKLKD